LWPGFFFLRSLPRSPATLCPHQFGDSLGLQVGDCGRGYVHAGAEAIPNLRFPSIAMSADAQAAVFAYAAHDRRLRPSSRRSCPQSEYARLIAHFARNL
jgi:hypothetical protein